MTKPRILFYDIETKPVRAWLWRTGNKISVSHDQIVEGDKFDIICICYKWLGESKIHSLDWGIKTQNSNEMLAYFTTIVQKADLVIGHNADSFDMKQINTQRLLHCQSPITWPTSEDTLKQFRKYFAFPSFKLDYLAKILTGSGKDRMCFQDWIDIVEKHDASALKKMIKYCKNDVKKLEEIYLQAAKFFKPKVHKGLLRYNRTDCCPYCSSFNFTGMGFRTTLSGRFRRFRCLDCGHSYSSTKKEKQRALTI